MYYKKVKEHLMTQIRQEIGALFREIRQRMGLLPSQDITPRVPQRPILHLSLKGRC